MGPKNSTRIRRGPGTGKDTFGVILVRIRCGYQCTAATFSSEMGMGWVNPRVGLGRIFDSFFDSFRGLGWVQRLHAFIVYQEL